MIGWLFVLAGALSVIAGVSVLVSPWFAVGGGVVLLVAGLVVDLDREEPKRGKRSQPAP